MDIRKLQRAIVDGLEDVKGQDIVVFNTEHLSPLFERVVVASGTSNRQTKALAASVRDAVRDGGGRVLSTEGSDNGEWIIVDCGSAVVHIMQPAIRQYYHLEEIWGGKPVKMKLADGARGLVKASEGDDSDDEDDAPVTPRRARSRADTALKVAATVPGKPKAAKTPAKSAAKSAATQPAAKKSTAAAPKAPAKKSGARGTATAAPAAKTAARKTAGKTAGKTATKAVGQPIKTIVINEPAPRPAARKAPARKSASAAPAARKAPARKAAPAKKAPAKKAAAASRGPRKIGGGG
jgi:ribosome-associated protein